jgi:hypothetical protein
MMKFCRMGKNGIGRLARNPHTRKEKEKSKKLLLNLLKIIMKKF